MARDVYPTWKRRLQAATDSAWVLTPYLDYSLVRLLDNAAERVGLIVVTDLSPDAGPANYRKKLLALKQLLARHVDVRALPRLHAKVLVLDEEVIIAGSQNFTSYARSSREVSAVSDWKPTRTLAVLTEWVRSARAVDIDLVTCLLECTESQAVVVDEAIMDLQAEVDNTITSMEERRAEKDRSQSNCPQSFVGSAEKLKKRVMNTAWRPAMGVAYLVPDTAAGYSEWYGAEDEYTTMYGTNS